MAPVSARTVGDKRKSANRPATSQPKGPRATGERRNGTSEVDTRALEEVVEALDAARRGDFSVRLSKRRKGVPAKAAVPSSLARKWATSPAVVEGSVPCSHVDDESPESP